MTANGQSIGQSRTLQLLIAAILVVSIDSRVIAPILPAIAEDLGVTIGRAGLIVTAYLLPYGLCQLAYGPLADRVGHVRVIQFALLGFALGGALCAIAPSLPLLVATRFLTGMVAAAVFPLTLAFIGETVAYAERQHAIGFTVMASALGQILSAGAGGFMAAVLSWRAIFVVDAVVSLIIAAAIWRSGAGTRRTASIERRTLRQGFGIVFADRRHALFYALIFFEGIFTLGAFSFFGAVLRDRDGFSYAAIGLILSVFGVTSVIAGRMLGSFVRRLGEQRMLLIGGIGTASCFMLTTLQPALLVFPLAMALMGMFYTVLHTTLQTRVTEIAPRARATGVSIFAFCLFVGSSIGALLLSYLIDNHGFTVSLLLMSAMSFAFAFAAAWGVLRWTEPSPDPLAA